jgi:putative IMPACT (imprinted ancient) family translation regulator
MKTTKTRKAVEMTESQLTQLSLMSKQEIITNLKHLFDTEGFDVEVDDDYEMDVDISMQIVEEWAEEWIQDYDNLKWLFNQHHKVDFDTFVYGGIKNENN